MVARLGVEQMERIRAIGGQLLPVRAIKGKQVAIGQPSDHVVPSHRADGDDIGIGGHMQVGY